MDTPDLSIRRAVATALLDPIDWDSSGSVGRVRCPGHCETHSQSDRATVYLLPRGGYRGPTITCFHHNSCVSAREAVNKELRSKIGRLEWEARVGYVKGKSIPRKYRAFTPQPAAVAVPAPLPVEQTIPARLQSGGKLADEAYSHVDMTPSEMAAEDIMSLFLPNELFAATVDVDYQPNFYIAREMVEWLQAGHDLSEIAVSDNGWFVCLNPLLRPVRDIASIAVARNGLFECDRNLTRGQQVSIFRHCVNMGLDGVNMVDSAGKSIHLRGRINAANCEAFRAEMQAMFRLFGNSIDKGVCDATRYSRLAGGFRGGKLQGLIQL